MNVSGLSLHRFGPLQPVQRSLKQSVQRPQERADMFVRQSQPVQHNRVSAQPRFSAVFVEDDIKDNKELRITIYPFPPSNDTPEEFHYEGLKMVRYEDGEIHTTYNQGEADRISQAQTLEYYAFRDRFKDNTNVHLVEEDTIKMMFAYADETAPRWQKDQIIGHIAQHQGDVSVPGQTNNSQGFERLPVHIVYKTPI